MINNETIYVLSEDALKFSLALGLGTNGFEFLICIDIDEQWVYVRIVYHVTNRWIQWHEISRMVIITEKIK